jgi:hypothetical protein
VVGLSEVAGDFTQGMVGGPTVDISSLAGATGFSVRYGERSLVAVTDAGYLQVRSGNNWAPQQFGVTDVAFAG